MADQYHIDSNIVTTSDSIEPVAGLVVNSTMTDSQSVISNVTTGGVGAKGDKGDTGATGLKGDKGDTGLTGAAGTNGQGVPTGGTTGQQLAKINGTDYNTQWVNPVDISGKADTTTLTAHTSNTSNPHSVTKAQVGLGNVDNTSDANKPISTATQTALDGKANFPSTDSHVPVRDGSGAQSSLRYTSGTTGYTIGFRTADGQIGVGAPTDNTHATTKAYVDTAVALKVNKAGDTITGSLTLPNSVLSSTGQISSSMSSGVAFAHSRGGQTRSWGVSGGGEFIIWNDTTSQLMLNVLNDRILLGGSTGIIRGTGFPEGVVTANVGSIYIDTAITNGASSWIKKSGTGSTGWRVLEGDTGIRNITSLLDAGAISGGNCYIRLLPNEVEVSIIGLTPASTNQLILTNIASVLGSSYTPYTINSAVLTGFSSPVYNRSLIVGAGSGEGIKVHGAAGAVWGSIVYKRVSSTWPSTLPGVAV